MDERINKILHNLDQNVVSVTEARKQILAISNDEKVIQEINKQIERKNGIKVPPAKRKNIDLRIKKLKNSLSLSFEDYQIAKKTVEEYEQKINEPFVINHTCAICESKTIKPIEGKHTNPLKLEAGMWDNGVVEKISFGYGSKHDTTSYYIAICDDCIDRLEKQGLAVKTKDISKKIYKQLGYI